MASRTTSDVTPYQRALVRHIDATIRIHLRNQHAQPVRRRSRASRPRWRKSRRPLTNILLRKPWVLTLFPTEAYAQDAEMSLREFEDFVYGATFADEPTIPCAPGTALEARAGPADRAARRAPTDSHRGAGTPT